uniref:FABP domain-containing protein n=1 Tax=Steinernema glaseri TaxID=37863 RepID=A0A1I7YPJ2_9BILA
MKTVFLCLFLLAVPSPSSKTFVGKWNFVSSENFEQYLKHVGVGLMTRKVESTLKPVLSFKVDGDKWTITSTSTFKVIVAEFVLGQEFDEITSDGRQMKPVLGFKVDGDKWTMTSTSTFKVIVTEFVLGQAFDETTADGRQMKSTFTFENGKLIQIQKKVKSSDRDSRIERFIDADGKLVILMESDGVVAKRVYEKASS